MTCSLQIAIAAGQDTPQGDKTCHLEISWRVNFLHSTMMKGVIENGARTGIKDSYVKYKEVPSFLQLCEVKQFSTN